MKKTIYLLPLWLITASAFGASIPKGSSYDSHIQNVTYNSQNSTVVNTRAGYVTTLIFSDDEEVVEASPGFEKGWQVTPQSNRVKVRPAPITQPVTDVNGMNSNQVFLPTNQDWQTNLFVQTTKRYYSLTLNIIDDDKPLNSLAYIVKYHYPDDIRKQSDAANQARERELQETRTKAQIEQAFNQATTPQNWDYSKRVAKGAELITPDFAYDDGRFTYLGFSPQKTIPSPFSVVNGSEQVSTPTFINKDSYRVMVVPLISPQFALRYGDAVVGIENHSYGKVIVPHGDTVSPNVVLEAK
ncbi:TPA: P-type conjugative transfer protein VirB9 [Providencia alcalifaciens]